MIDTREPLTGAQRRMLVAIAEHMAEHGISPSYAWLMGRLGFASKNAIFELLRRLENKRYIVTELAPSGNRKAHAIAILDARGQRMRPNAGKWPRRLETASGVTLQLATISGAA